MSANPHHRNELIAQLIWQSELGADEAIHDQPAHAVPDVKLADILSAAPDIGGAEPTDMAANIPSRSVPNALNNPAAAVSAAPESSVPSPATMDLRTPTDATDGTDASAGSTGMGAAVAGDAELTAQLAAIKSLAELREALSQFDRCALKNTASNLVFSDGNPGARVMLIGEAPGRDEDRVGLPFVGASGQLLDKMLASIGLDRTSVYIANLLPWRPPGNRTPTAEETTMLLPWLRRHIQLANPDYLMILGGSSSKALLGEKDGILKLRGKWRNFDYGDGINRPTICSLHPAFLLRSPAQKRLSFQDLLALAAKLQR